MLFNGYIAKLSVLRVKEKLKAPLSKAAQEDLKGFCKIVQQRSGGSFKTVIASSPEECLEGIRLQVRELVEYHGLTKHIQDIEFRANVNDVKKGLAYEAFGIATHPFFGLEEPIEAKPMSAVA